MYRVSDIVKRALAVFLSSSLVLSCACASGNGSQTAPADVSTAESTEAVQDTEPDKTKEAAQEDNAPAGIIKVAPSESGSAEESAAASDKELIVMPLKDAFSQYFKVGVAVQAIDHWNDQTAEIGNPDKEAIIRREFNSITFGNEWKPAYNFSASSDTLYRTDSAAEELLNWGKENGIPVRGHTLVWHSQCDPAIFAKDFKAKANGVETHDWTAGLDEDCLVDRDTLLSRLKTYIYGLIEYTYQNGYADTVYAFDVVNEACDEGRPDGMRNSYYYSIIGPDFLYFMFLYAREAEYMYAEKYADLYGLDPATDDLSPIIPKLFYNDYNEWVGGRVRAITGFLSEEKYNEGQKLIKSSAIAEGGDGSIAGDGLVDGIGMQGHLDDTQNIETYMKALRSYNEIVSEVQITELDVGKTSAGDTGEIKQAAFYNEFFRKLIEECENGVNLTSVTFWGLTDDASWRKGADPLLYRSDLSEKPAYEALQMAAAGMVYDAKNPPTARDASELVLDFEPKSVDGKLVNPTPEELSFTSRGSGHQSKLDFANKINHTEGAIIGRSLIVTREEKDATVRFDISRFIGNVVKVTMFVKTDDKEIVFGVTGDEDIEAGRIAVTEEWTPLECTLDLDDALASASVYIETDGSGDFYIDDVNVVKQ